MKLDGKFLTSKVARRVFTLFVLCALLPISVLAALSYRHVTQELMQLSQQRLYRASKAVGMGVYERLLLLETELKLLAREHRGPTGSGVALRQLPDDLEQRFAGLAIREGRTLLTLYGHTSPLRDLSHPQLEHVRSGKSLVVAQGEDGARSRMFMIRHVMQGSVADRILVAELQPAYLWGIGEHNTIPAGMELCVVDTRGQVHLCSARAGLPFERILGTTVGTPASRFFAWEHEGEEHLGSFWSLPLKLRFGVPAWSIVVSEPRSVALAPLTNFAGTFPLVVLLTIWVVILLSLIHIRRSLVPLERLQVGTRKVANHDFSSPVKVDSQDEFAELAQSFNAMAARLNRQFCSLATMREIDRVVLSSQDTRTVIETVLTLIPDLVDCDFAGVALRDPTVPQAGWMYVRACRTSQPTSVESVEVTLDTLQEFHQHPDSLLMGAERRPEALAPILRRGCHAVLVLPLFRGDWVLGYLALGVHRDCPFDPEELVEVRQVADQVAVALSNVEDLEARLRAEALLRESHQRLEQALEDLRTTQARVIHRPAAEPSGNGHLPKPAAPNRDRGPVKKPVRRARRAKAPGPPRS